MTYEMLAGEPPFTGPTVQAIVARLMSEAPRALATQRPVVPPHVEAVVLQGLEKIPADRFASAAEFAEAMRGGTGARVAATSVVRNAEVGRARSWPWRSMAPRWCSPIRSTGSGNCIASSVAPSVHN